jgi:BclA C-terminal domain
MADGRILNTRARVVVTPSSGGGATGATGASGATGAGSTGATGVGAFVPSFAHFFALMPGDNAATVAVGAAVQFPQDGPTNGVAVRASASTFTIPLAGTYEITWQVSVDEAGQLQVAFGGTGDALTVAGRATGTNQIYNTVVVTTISPGAVLSIINPTGNAAALTITPIAGGTHAVSATLTIKRLA